MRHFTIGRVAVAGLLTAVASLAAVTPARATSVDAVWQYLNDRVQWVRSPGPGGCTRSVTMSVTTINAGGVASYIGRVQGTGGDLGANPPTATYTPPASGGGLAVPEKFGVHRVRQMFSDKGHFDPAQAPLVTIQIVMRPTGPVVSVTMHNWGDAVVTFPLLGANNGVLYGDDNPQSHMAIVLAKQDCAAPPR